MVDDLLSKIENGRLVPKEKYDNLQEYLLYLRHVTAYNFTLPYVIGRSVLDVGCGAGYGTYFLSNHAKKVIGIDISKEAIEYCNRTYTAENLNFVQTFGRSFPFEEASFDTCISLQVIEHINPREVKHWLSEIKKVMKNKGTLIVSTPNKKLRLLPFQRPWNTNHQKEYDFIEFRKLLQSSFGNVKIKGLYGTKNIQIIEGNRVKQKPINVYVRNPLIDLFHHYPIFLKRFVNEFYFTYSQNKKIQMVNLSSVPEKDLLEKYSLNDFRINDKHFDDCLDLLAICSNSNYQ